MQGKYISMNNTKSIKNISKIYFGFNAIENLKNIINDKINILYFVDIYFESNDILDKHLYGKNKKITKWSN